MHKPYRGRFAPSPTGDLHLGSLLSAVASYLQARKYQGQWLIRIEDIDPPREVHGSAAGILKDLKALGMQADEDVGYQSHNTAAYQQALASLLSSGKAFRCGCSRKQLKNDPVYPGNCRKLQLDACAVRLKAATRQLTVIDQLQKSREYALAEDIGDFIIWRADDLPAYQLAVVVDDAAMGITEVVRGCDLQGSTPRQLYLQECLGLPHPDYLHIPLLTDKSGRKLSKRDNDDPLNQLQPLAAIRLALRLLGQQPPPEISDLNKLWEWAIVHWQASNIPLQFPTSSIRGLGC
ncbi:MAG: tRNA glutamyl-Q(34) synthetase GluQRS [Xanthomonadales bacterium]|nr:tRNA glutamyl-Q(34) synthetase GluQRS [Xanthomonadales bacterium]